MNVHLLTERLSLEDLEAVEARLWLTTNTCHMTDLRPLTHIRSWYRQRIQWRRVGEERQKIAC